MPVSLRALGATIALALSPSLAACGGGDDGKTLNQAQYDKLTEVYEGAVQLQALPSSERNADRYEEASKPLVDACQVLAGEDAIQRSVRLTCGIPAQLAGQYRILGLCDRQPQLCTDAVPEIRKLLADFIRNGREADSTLDDAGLADDCLKALKPPKLQYEVYQAYGRTFTVLEEAQVAQSKAGAQRADRMLKAADKQAEELPTAKERLDAFKSACKPS